MGEAALVAEAVAAGQEFVRRFGAVIPVAAAYWQTRPEADGWKFVIASDRFVSGRVGTAYADVIRIANELNSPYLDPYQVELVGLHDRTARAVLEFYRTHPARIPHRVRGWDVGLDDVNELHLVQGPTGDYAMPSGREALNQIIDREAEFFQQHGTAPRKMRLPVLLAYDLAKCGREELGDISGRVFKDGITVFEREGFHGMNVEIVRDRNAALEFE
jgi:hypothetical protein